jgi:hypothetical protein
LSISYDFFGPNSNVIIWNDHKWHNTVFDKYVKTCNHYNLQ